MGSYDWNAMRRRACKHGELPAPPHVDDRRKRLLADINRWVAADNRRALRDLPIRGTNSYAKALTKYRDICLIALEQRQGCRQV